MLFYLFDVESRQYGIFIFSLQKNNFSFLMSLRLSSPSVYHHFLFLFCAVSPKAVLSNPRYPNTVSPASSSISRYFSLSYFAPVRMSYSNLFVSTFRIMIQIFSFLQTSILEALLPWIIYL
jgi:hypothetical protein